MAKLTMADAIDNAIQVVIHDDDDKARMLVDFYDGMPSTVSKDDYFEFAKRNLEGQLKAILENLKEGLR